MANVENLTQKILDDAKREAAEILEQAKERAAHIAERKNRETQEEVHRIHRHAENEAERSRERVLSGAKLTARNEELAIKQEKMDETFLRAKALLSEMSDRDYRTFVEQTLGQLGTTEAQTLIVPEKRKQAVGAQLAGRPVEVSADAEDGFSVRQGKLFFNYNFNALVDSARDELEQEVRDALFKKEV